MDRRRFLHTAAALPAVFLGGCEALLPETEPPPDFGVPALRLEIGREELSWLHGNVFSERYVPARLETGGRAYRVEVRHQGGVSRTSIKKNYRLRFPEEGPNPDGFRRVVLSAQYSGPSLLTGRIGFDLFRDAGFMAPHSRWVALHLNGSYAGLYLMLEPVDADFLLRRGRREGSLYRAHTNADLTFRDGPYDVRDGMEKQWGTDDSYTDVEYLIHVLDTAATDALPERLEAILDVPGYLGYIAVCVLIDHRDGFLKNYAFYRDPDLGRFVVIPWDLDSTFTTPAVWFPFGLNRLSARLMEVPRYRAAYLARLGVLFEDVFPYERFADEVETYRARIAEAYRNDPYLQARGFDLDEQAARLLVVMRDRRIEIRRLLSGT